MAQEVMFSSEYLASSPLSPDPLEHTADDEKVVKHREDHEKAIENEAVHLLRAEDRDGDGLRREKILQGATLVWHY